MRYSLKQFLTVLSCLFCFCSISSAQTKAVESKQPMVSKQPVVSKQPLVTKQVTEVKQSAISKQAAAAKKITEDQVEVLKEGISAMPVMPVVSAVPNLPVLAEIDSVAIMKNLKVKAFKQNAHASYYHDKLNGRRTASGKPFNNKKFTAAHRTLPFGTKLLLTNSVNKKSVIVEVNDRGPFTKSREIDITKAAFMQIATSSKSGFVDVVIEVVQ